MNVTTDYITVAICPIVLIPLDHSTAFANLEQIVKVSFWH